ncbi:hypothetical protein GCK72_016093 [Caenorhabditis remanei]|uniref:Uncharacterized protein n=1 Tax=Caenorhabditis remanei TaxID=31234 RepID=A0A6A5GYH5_CAERE|nr:hypothetical protein GCK72_016093 [Caenorhabditis remanei]KAF1759626.1 hypothetical protein GCK72_016093 [Caenorhabditis remanei]
MHFLTISLATCLLLISQSIAVSDVTTKFHFSGTISCNRTDRGSHYVSWIELWESDSIVDTEWTRFADDRLEQNYTLDWSKNPVKFALDAVAHGDGFEMISQEYELYYRIKHNCNKDRAPEIKKINVFGTFVTADRAYRHIGERLDVTS